jgi:hypothetical protein
VIYTSTATHLVADLAGYFEAATTSRSGREVPLTPARILDTRPGPKQLNYSGSEPGPGVPVTLNASGRGGVPVAGASAVILNLTATGADGPGYVTVWPDDQPQPVASNLNLMYRGQTIATAVIVRLNRYSNISIAASVKTHLVADVVGYFTDHNAPIDDSGLFVPVTPTRVLDTRPAYRTPASAAPVPANGTISVSLAASPTVPPGGAAALMLNVTATQPQSTGYVTAFPAGQPRPLASRLNIDYVGQTIANLSPVATSASTTVSLYSVPATHLIADLSGYFTR